MTNNFTQRRRTEAEKEAAKNVMMLSIQAANEAHEKQIRDTLRRSEEKFLDHPERRSEIEHPETAYRRGYQQGANEVMQAMLAAGLIDQKTVSTFTLKSNNWRHGKRSLKRELLKDRAPKLSLK
jgi:hypothetical protein